MDCAFVTLRGSFACDFARVAIYAVRIARLRLPRSVARVAHVRVARTRRSGSLGLRTHLLLPHAAGLRCVAGADLASFAPLMDLVCSTLLVASHARLPRLRTPRTRAAHLRSPFAATHTRLAHAGLLRHGCARCFLHHAFTRVAFVTRFTNTSIGCTLLRLRVAAPRTLVGFTVCTLRTRLRGLHCTHVLSVLRAADPISLLFVCRARFTRSFAFTRACTFAVHAISYGLRAYARPLSSGSRFGCGSHLSLSGLVGCALCGCAHISSISSSLFKVSRLRTVLRICRGLRVYVCIRAPHCTRTGLSISSRARGCLRCTYALRLLLHTTHITHTHWLRSVGSRLHAHTRVAHFTAVLYAVATPQRALRLRHTRCVCALVNTAVRCVWLQHAFGSRSAGSWISRLPTHRVCLPRSLVTRYTHARLLHAVLARILSRLQYTHTHAAARCARTPHARLRGCIARGLPDSPLRNIRSLRRCAGCAHALCRCYAFCRAALDCGCRTTHTRTVALYGWIFACHTPVAVVCALHAHAYRVAVPRRAGYLLIVACCRLRFVAYAHARLRLPLRLVWLLRYALRLHTLLHILRVAALISLGAFVRYVALRTPPRVWIAVYFARLRLLRCVLVAHIPRCVPLRCTLR